MVFFPSHSLKSNNKKWIPQLEKEGNATNDSTVMKQEVSIHSFTP
jgi:hypothetical protein